MYALLTTGSKILISLQEPLITHMCERRRNLTHFLPTSTHVILLNFLTCCRMVIVSTSMVKESGVTQVLLCNYFPVK